MTDLSPQKLYQTIIDQKSEPIWIIKEDNGNFIIIDLNSSAKQLFGKIPEQEQNYNVSSYFSEEGPIINLLHECYDSKDLVKKSIYFNNLEKKNPSHICADYINDNYLILEIIDNLIRAKLKNRRMEEYPYKYPHSGEFSKNLIEQSLMGIAILQNNRLIYVNKRFSDIMGYNQEELLNFKPRGFLELVHPDYREFVEEQAKKKQSGLNNQKISYDFKAIKKSGEELWVREYSKTIHYRGKKADFISLIDITEMKKAERKLKESEEMFRLIANESLPSIAIIQDNDFKYINPQFGRALGFQATTIKDWRPRDFIQHVHPEDRKKVIQELNKKQSGDKNSLEPYEFRVVTKSGKIIWRKVYSKSITYHGKPADLAVLVDVTEKKIVQRNLKKSKKKYKIAYERANFYKDLLIHDINNILQSIKTASELAALTLKERMDFQEIKNLWETINEHVTRGAMLVKNIQRLSEIEEQEIQKKRINLCNPLKNCIEFIKTSFPNKNIDISVQPYDDYIYVEANELLRDVFENLLINAVKYNQNDIISVKININEKIGETHNWVKLQFIDNARGIKDKNKELIFQEDKMRKKSEKGMGFGLTLVKKIIDSYNGKIWVENRISDDYTKGSKFNILLPLQ
ncbi:MAG: PAS domain S-box protein [Promethearchaeia archaeon]